MGLGSSRRQSGRLARRLSAAACWILPIPLAGCWGIPLKEPVAVIEQAQRSAAIRPGESTREGVRAALGEPWLSSRFWGFDAYRARDTSRELGMFLYWPVPLVGLDVHEEGYVLVAYDAVGRVEAVASGVTSRESGQQQPLMLRAGGLNLGVEAIGRRGPQLMADADRLREYLALRRGSADCSVLLACEERGYRKWPFEGCPDRVAVDDAQPVDPLPFFGTCDPGTSCPHAILPQGTYERVPLVYAIALPAGPHRIELTSTTFQGRSTKSFECTPGEVRYGVLRGHVEWRRWGPRASTLHSSVRLRHDMPARWASYSVLLYRGDRWIVQREPDEPRAPPAAGVRR